MSKTQAAILTQLQKPLELMTLDLPKLKEGQVLVDIAYSGICHTQILEMDGCRGEDRYLPHTLGHEGAGIVRDIGPGITKVKPGDRVVLTWIKGVGKDVPASQYKYSDQTINSGAISTFLKTAVIAENRLIPIAPEMPLKTAALLGCAVPTGAGIMMNTVQLKPQHSVAIFGVGGIGLGCVLGARLRQASTIIAIDLFDHKLEIARKMGATHTVNAEKEDVPAAIQKITGRRGVDFSVEAVGRVKTMETAFESVRYQGGVCVLAGNVPFGQKISIDPFDLIKGRHLIGTWGGETQPDRDIPFYVKKYLDEELPLDLMISEVYPLEQINQAVSDMKNGKVSRALIDMGF